MPNKYFIIKKKALKIFSKITYLFFFFLNHLVKKNLSKIPKNSFLYSTYFSSFSSAAAKIIYFNCYIKQVNTMISHHSNILHLTRAHNSVYILHIWQYNEWYMGYYWILCRVKTIKCKMWFSYKIQPFWAFKHFFLNNEVT